MPSAAADAFAVETMQNLGRSPVPAGALLFRVTGAQADKSISILSSHPLTEERLETMKIPDRKPTGPELLTAAQWTALEHLQSQRRGAYAPAVIQFG